MYRLPTAIAESHGVTEPLTSVTAVTRIFGHSVRWPQAMAMLYANGVEPDTADLAHTGPYAVSTRSVCRAIRAMRPVAA